MAKVSIVMGSDSDMPVMAQAADFLEEMGIDFEMTIISGQRLQGDYRRSGKSGSPAGHVRGSVPHAGHRHPHENV